MSRIGLLIAVCVCTAFAQVDREATFVLKDGSVMFGKLNKMENDTVYLETSADKSAPASRKYPKSAFTEIIFDNGEKFDLSVSNYPIKTAAASSENPVSAVIPQQKTEPDKSNYGNGLTQPGTIPATGVSAGNIRYDLAGVRNPFSYAGLSAVVPGLGQLLQGDYVKAAIWFPLVVGCAGGSLGAWNYTAKTYNNLQSSYHSNGSYDNTLYSKFIFQSNGAEALSVVTAVLYVINIADAAFDAHLYNMYKTGRFSNSVSVSGNGISYDLSLNF